MQERAVTATDPVTIRLADYRPFSHLVDRVSLTFSLAPSPRGSKHASSLPRTRRGRVATICGWTAKA